LNSINGNTDLSLDPHLGVLSDPSANYTFEVTLQEMMSRGRASEFKDGCNAEEM
jgi:hypothetical protein